MYRKNNANEFHDSWFLMVQEDYLLYLFFVSRQVRCLQRDRLKTFCVSKQMFISPSVCFHKLGQGFSNLLQTGTP